MSWKNGGAIRDEPGSGRKQRHINAKTTLKLGHLQNLALWAAAESSIPPLAAFFGERLAATTEAVGTRSDPSLFICEKCETILRPGNNCTVRIETIKPKKRRDEKKPSSDEAQNVVVSGCHFCSHRNVIRGTRRGYLKEILPPKAKPSIVTKKVENAVPLAVHLQTPPSPASGISLLDSNRRKGKRNKSDGGAKKVEDSSLDKNGGSSSSKRRKRSSWVSLEKLALQNKNVVY